MFKSEYLNRVYAEVERRDAGEPEFLQAVQQKRPANTPFEMGGKFTIMGFMGMIATRFPGRRLTFDPVTMRCTNCPEANAFMGPDWTDAARAEYGRFL